MTILNTAVFGKPYSAFLFDMDGTLLTSILSAERVWGRWADRHGLDKTTFIPTIHGKRAIDTISQLNLPGVDAQEEADWVTREEIIDVEGISPIPGAADFLAALTAGRWAVVTSAPRPLAEARLKAAGLALPQCIVTADEVKTGKPSPEGYLLGAKKLGFAPAECLVFEDVTAGILAGEAAGSDVMVISATHTHVVETAHPKIDSYHEISLTSDAAGKLVLARR